MILDESSFLKLFLENPEIPRLSRAVNPKDTNTLLILRTSGIQESSLLPVAARLLSSFRDREYLLSNILNLEVKIGLKSDLVENIVLDLSNTLEDPESVFPKGFALALYRDQRTLYATRWK